MIGDLIGEWIKGILIDGIMGNLSGLFNTVNTKVGEIASDVGSTPQDWNGGIFSMLQNLSETVIVPIAAALIMVFAMLPGFLLALYEKHGQPLEVVVRQIVECCFIQPKERPYQTNNAYTALVRQSQMEKEVNAIVQKAKERNERKSAGQAHPRRKERDSGRHPKV